MTWLQAACNSAERAEVEEGEAGTAGDAEVASPDGFGGGRDIADLEETTGDGSSSDGEGGGADAGESGPAWCVVEGEAPVYCPVVVVRASAAVPAPVELSAALTYDAVAVAFEGAFWLPPGAGSAVVATPPALLPTGHTVALVPGLPSAWGGAGSITLAPDGPPAPLTTALATDEAPLPLTWLRFRRTGGGDGAIHLKSPQAKAPNAALLAQVEGLRVVVDGESLGPAPECTSTAACDDGLGCTTDVCTADGACVHELLPGGCLIDGTCVPQGTVHPTNPCQQCDITIWTDAWAPRPGVPCDDGDACTTAGVCDKGTCTGVEPVACDDANPCTADGCTAQKGCTVAALPPASPCSDGDACTVGEQCTDGACVPGTALDCDDGDPCTDDLCDPASGCASIGGGTGACTCVVGRTRVVGCGRVFVWGDEHVRISSYGMDPLPFWRQALAWLAEGAPCGGPRTTVSFMGGTTDAMLAAAAEVGLSVVSGGLPSSLPQVAQAPDIVVGTLYPSGTAEELAAVTAWLEGGGALMAMTIGFGSGSPDECDASNALLAAFGLVYGCQEPVPWGPVELPAAHPILSGLVEANVPFVNGRWVLASPGVPSAVVGQVIESTCPEAP